jgi:hypothetical protein
VGVKVAGSSKTSINFCRTTQRHMLKDNTLYCHRWDNCVSQSKQRHLTAPVDGCMNLMRMAMIWTIRGWGNCWMNNAAEVLKVLIVTSSNVECHWSWTKRNSLSSKRYTCKFWGYHSSAIENLSLSQCYTASCASRWFKGTCSLSLQGFKSINNKGACGNLHLYGFPYNLLKCIRKSQLCRF